ncbi:MAG: hypothetical protein NTZ52_05205 [Chlamydiae bacterium]|nr:hypothetical protein [Chlamydiota bacterium]
MTKSFAEESAKTRKAREKLKKKLDAIDQQITPQAIQEKTFEIHRWIERHASQRTILRNKNISLFDENQNAADLSKKVSELAEQLRKDFQVLSQKAVSSFDARPLLQTMLKTPQNIATE